MKQHQLPNLLFLLLLVSLNPVSSLDFVFNGFKTSNLLLYGNATIQSRILTLTNATTRNIGRALYPIKIRAKDPKSSLVLPFSTSFIFAMAPVKNSLPGHGIVFLFVPYTGINGAADAQHFGFLNRTSDGDQSARVLGIEFDVFKNREFKDYDDNHVGIDVNSLTSNTFHTAGYWLDDTLGNDSFQELKLNNGKNYQVWIDYADFHMNVTMATAGMKKPKRPLLMDAHLNLSQVFENEMYMGFTAATGSLIQGHKILAWSFSNSNFSLSDALITTGLPSFELPKDPIYKSLGFIVGMTVGLLFVLVVSGAVTLVLIRRHRRIKREREDMEEWELQYWPHRVAYQEIDAATKKFSDVNVIGFGGNGKVYKGILQSGAEVAVKRITHENSEGIKEFVSEISSLGRLKHRNLVGLRGWCKKEKGSLIVIYDYMENGSLDKWIFERDEDKMLGCEDRVRILKDVASAVLYLHEGWESKVLHRDIKASNVLLDKEMNARLGDFGLARMHAHAQVANTTRVVGTVGYLAPEVVKSGRASTQTDVFGFGVLILEVMCGRRPVEEGKPPLLDWVRQLADQGELLNTLDERLRARGGSNDEVERILQIGLLCTCAYPQARPSMRQVLSFLEGRNEIDESECEDMDVRLLERMKSKDFLSRYTQTSGSHKFHPTFEELREGLSSSMSVSWSNSFVEGDDINGNEEPSKVKKEEYSKEQHHKG